MFGSLRPWRLRAFALNKVYFDRAVGMSPPERGSAGEYGSGCCAARCLAQKKTGCEQSVFSIFTGEGRGAAPYSPRS
jgi:hypothetical protein